MKKILILIIIFGSVISQEISPSDGSDSSISFGFLSEKIPISIIEYSRLLDIDERSEFYFSIGSMLFATGIGSGYKYYFNSKYSSSKFISIGYHLSYLGTADEGMVLSGISFSPGYSIIYKENSSPKITYRESFGSQLKEVVYKKTAINVGISFLYLSDNSFGAFPFINLERRF
tara:strand:- start:49 stop:570 length:522 start_codon:yes stop_codon:yes gene_type:complete